MDAPSSAPALSPPPAEGGDFARRDLATAVVVALHRDGHLLTAGEQHIARTFLGLPDPAASLYARLHSRRPALFRRDQLQYAEVPDISAASERLVAAGLALDDRLLPARLLLTLRTVEELKDLCRAGGLRTTGRREDLLGRLEAAALPRATVGLSALLLRHRGLFTRLCRLYLHDHSGDLSMLVVARLGHVRFPEYTPTGGLGLFPDRQELLAYEEALGLRGSEPTAEAWIAGLPGALATVEARPLPPDHRHRFSARRLATEQALVAARLLERAGDLAAVARAEEAYRRLLQAGVREAGSVAWRRALCLERLGRGEEGAHLCADHREGASPEEALGLERTGRRLARKYRVSWRPLPPLREAGVRTLDLDAAPRVGHRPGYVRPMQEGHDGEGSVAIPVEAALVARLAAAGRRAFFGEAAPWSTLFGVLCIDALLAPVPGMLPTPLLHRPLDLGTPGFAARRSRWLEPLLARIVAGEACTLLEETLPRVEGRAVAGVRWDRFTPDHLRALVAGLDGPSLGGILRGFAEDWAGAQRGLPDLCVLPGPETQLARAWPTRLPPGLLLVEAKGPTDALRDAQRVWIDRLLRLGVPVEVWKVRTSAAEAAEVG